MAVNISTTNEDALAKLASGQGPAANIKFLGLGRKIQDAAQSKLETAPGYQTAQYSTQAAKALPQLYAPAYRAISQQLQPQMARARAYFGGNPAAANSGNANRINRLLQQQAYGQLGQSMTGTTADVARGGLDLLSNLIKRRAEARYQEEADKRAKEAQGGFWNTLSGVAGGVAGAVL